MAKKAPIKISIVKYLNAVPLAWGILEGSQKEAFDPVLSTPAECADQLARGSVDIGLIPSIEYQRIKGCRIVPGPAVAATHRESEDRGLRQRFKNFGRTCEDCLQ